MRLSSGVKWSLKSPDLWLNSASCPWSVTHHPVASYRHALVQTLRLLLLLFCPLCCRSVSVTYSQPGGPLIALDSVSWLPLEIRLNYISLHQPQMPFDWISRAAVSVWQCVCTRRCCCCWWKLVMCSWHEEMFESASVPSINYSTAVLLSRSLVISSHWLLDLLQCTTLFPYTTDTSTFSSLASLPLPSQAGVGAWAAWHRGK